MILTKENVLLKSSGALNTLLCTFRILSSFDQVQLNVFLQNGSAYGKITSLFYKY